MLLSSSKNNRQGRGLGSPVTGRAWLNTRIPPAGDGPDTAPQSSPCCRAACLPQPLAGAGAEQGLFQEGEEQTELLLPKRAGWAFGHQLQSTGRAPTVPRGQAVCVGEQCSSTDRHWAEGGTGSTKEVRIALAQAPTFGCPEHQGQGDTAPAISESSIDTPFTTAWKAASQVQMWMQTLEHLQRSQWKQFDQTFICHLPLALWEQPQQQALLTREAGRAALAKPAPEQLQSRSHSQRRWPHEPQLNACPCVTHRGVGFQSVRVPSGW